MLISGSGEALQFWPALLALLLLAVSPLRAETIIGNRAGCSQEGEIVPTRRINIKHFSCFTCICKNGFIECEREMCAGQEGCFMLEQKQRDGQCCRQCRGCVQDGLERRSGEEWRDPEDPCKLYQCTAGVITIAQEVCHSSHCHHLHLHLLPLPNRCCKSCKDCKFNGQHVAEGREVTTPEDPCLKCRCERGHLTCSKRGCPVLQCPPSQTVHTPGECCPVCSGNRSLVELQSGACILRTAVLKSGQTRIIDPCTSCTCNNGTIVCERQTCSVLSCSTELQTTAPGQCCPHCPPVEESRAVCTVKGQTYEDEETWKLDECVTCTCRQGAPRCARAMCPQVVTSCPPRQKLEREPGDCCARCVEADEEAVCTVFGDPHYRTFDGKFYSFQGSCKYLLSADCVGRTFTIRVNNDARHTKTWSWTKTVALKIGDLKVNLGQKMRVKINGERIKPPFRIEGQLSIERTEENIVVKTAMGVRLLWNGNSFLEVFVPAAFKNRLCGLCGNYNGIPKDDLKTRRGRMTNDTDKFGMSWRVGGKKACDRQYELMNSNSNSNATINSATCWKRTSKKSPCQLIKHHVFDECRMKINDHVYLRSCGMDMCECPGQLCYCEALTAYAHECTRQGVPLPDWRQHVACPLTAPSVSVSAPNTIHNTRPQPQPQPRPKWPTLVYRPMNRTTKTRPPPPLIH